MRFHFPFRIRTATLIIVPFILIASYAVHEASGNSGGVYGYSKVGCGLPTQYGCHGTQETATVISLWSDASTIQAGQTYIFHLSVANANSNEHAAGCDISVDNGARLSTNGGYSSGLRVEGAELTHTGPRPFTGDSAVWTFKYTAPTRAGTAHVYVAANAVNYDGINDAGDHWNVVVDTLNIVAAGVTPANEQNADVIVYPNPSSTGHFMLSTTGLAGPSELIATDASGRTVFHSSIELGDEAPLDLSALANGTYFLSIRAADGRSFVRRLVLAR